MSAVNNPNGIVDINLSSTAPLPTQVSRQGALATGEQVLVPVQPQSLIPLGEGAQIRAAILQLVISNPDIDISKVEALSKMQTDLEDRESRRAFDAAFVRLQGALPAIKKDGRLEYDKEKGKPEAGKYLVAKYAMWEDILAAITPILAAHGFSMRYDITPRTDTGGGLLVSCILSHAGGHTERGSPIPVALDTSGGKNNTQAYGSAMSYGQRYATKAMLNLRWEGEDDDGVNSGIQTLSDLGDTGLAMAARIKELVTASYLKGPALKDWFEQAVSYPVAKFQDIRPEDYDRLIRLLRIEEKKVNHTGGAEV